MKKLFTLLFFIFLVGITNVNAQTTGYPIATLEHNGTTSVFYGINAFQSAYNNANNGDTIYLSADNFYSSGIYKTIHVYGAGSADPLTPSTTFNDWMYLYGGSDSSTFEGLQCQFYFNGYMDKVKIKRCRIDNITFANSYPTNTLVENCFIQTANLVWCNGQTTTFRNNIFLTFSYWYSSLLDNASNVLFEHNHFLGGYYSFNNISNCFFRNNIFYTYRAFSDFMSSFTTCVFDKNIINEYSNSNFNFGDTTTYNTNVFLSNYYTVNANLLNSSISNCWGCNYSLQGDYHLINPTLYMGTDSTEVGAYGGINPFREHATPSNPHIVSKTIPFITNSNGILPVNIKVKAQKY